MKKLLKISVLILGIFILPFSAYYGQAQEKLVELNWYFVGYGEDEDTELVEKAINKYIQNYTNLNCTINLHCYDWGSYNSKMAKKIKNREEFDICFTANWSLNYYDNAKEGAFLRLNELLPIYAPKTTALLGEGYLKGTEINGSCYGIPSYKNSVEQYSLFIRKDLAEKYKMNLSTVKNLEDMEPFFEVIKEKETDIYALNSQDVVYSFGLLNMKKLLPTENLYHEDAVAGPGAVYYDTKDYRVFNELERPEVIAFFKQMHSYYEAGYISGNAINEANRVMTNVFCTIDIAATAEHYDSTYQGYEYIRIPISNPIVPDYCITNAIQAISSTSKHPEEAIKFLELVNTDKYINNLLIYGIKDIHYTKVKGKNDIIQFTENHERYYYEIPWILGNVKNTYSFTETERKGKQEISIKNQMGQVDTTMGFVFDFTPVQEQIQKCELIWDPYVHYLSIGLYDPEVYVPIVLKSLEDCGSKEIIAEMQRQLDEWKNLQEK